MESIMKAERLQDKDSEDEREGDYGSGDEKARSDDDNCRKSVSPACAKQLRNKSSSRSCSPSSSATSDSPKRSRSRSLSKEQPHHEDLEKGNEKTKEPQNIQGKLEPSDKKFEKSLHNKSNRNYRDQRKRSGSREKTPKSSRSSSHRNHGGRKRSRSRSRDRRSKSIERKSKRSRSRERRSRSKGRRSRSRDRRSRSRDRRSRSKERRSKSRDRRSRSRERRDRRSRSRSRDRYRRSRSRDRNRRRHRYDRRRSHSRGRPRDFKEKALSNLRAALEKTVKLDGEGLTVDAASLEKPSNLPLNVTSASVMTPQIVLQQAMAAMSAKAQALTGISLPKYYNPAAVNPLKYAEQVQKRKLLWQANKEKPEQSAKAGSASLWENMTFAQDQDGKMTAKFRKLMGIKSDGSAETQPEEEKSVPQSEDAVKKQEALFRDLDQQYEMARMSTHTHRGVGLGYTSHASSIYPPVPK